MLHVFIPSKIIRLEHAGTSVRNIRGTDWAVSHP